MATIQASVGHNGRNRSTDVTVIQQLINSHIRLIPPTQPLAVDGAIGPKTINAIRSYQRQVLGMSSPDGRVDPNGRTLASLNNEQGNGPRAAQAFHYPVGPQEPLIEIARPYLGAREARGNHMGNDPRMREIFESDWIESGGVTDGYAWCCSFVSMCVQKLIRQDSIYSGVKPPKTAGVTDFRTRWAVRQNCLVFAPNHAHHRPHKGDIVVFTFSHIGIVDSVGEHSVTTIEGNTNEAGSREGTSVMNKTRPYSLCRCFIRLPIPSSYDVDNQICTV